LTLERARLGVARKLFARKCDSISFVKGGLVGRIEMDPALIEFVFSVLVEI
jgi:hypothetical protein